MKVERKRKKENLQVVHEDILEESRYQRKKDHRGTEFQLRQQCTPSRDPSFPRKL